ncbi:SusC/RagA family TonB-linked outer membrane protein [Rheinheimera sp. MM224]|uniref:SusC/RagA family TonB-linked outer membrane protein n=1 Tax=Rheinheimera sp. MM224 TaxID=3019969 RepID=UPI0021F850A3|nr:SusC/RagA family TonB-linked outer membrane protein [Rheinheimera sp. MM224]CAI3797991.1 TonB-dependent receptor P26 [Rheinheimera sp. MM224]
MKTFSMHPLARGIHMLLTSSTLLLPTFVWAEQQTEPPIQEEQKTNKEKEQQDIEIIQVSYGYASVEKKDLTGAIATVKLEDIADMPAGNIMQNLQGRVPGLQITTSGNPSSAATVRIRGQGLGPLGNNDPLYVIDGIPTKSGLHEINSNDIADVQVLRDAASSSIYGSRAGNGVIVVTTKKGQEGLDFNFRFNQTRESYNYDLQPLNTEQRGVAVWRAAVNDKTNPNTASPLYNFDWNGDYDNPQLNSVNLPAFTDPDNLQRPADTRWFDLVTREADVRDFNASLSGGDDNSRYYSSFGYYDSDGIVDGSSFERMAFRLNSEHELIKDRLKLGQTFLLTNQVGNLINDLAGQILSLSIEQQSIVPVFNDEGGWGGPVPGITDRDNPVRIIEQNRDNTHRFNKVMPGFFVEYSPLNDLKLKSSLSVDYSQFYFRNFTRSFKAGTLTFGDRLTVDDNWSRSIIASNTASYKVVLNDKHNFNLLAGIEQINFKSESARGIGSGFASNDRDFAFLSQATRDVRVEGDGDSWALDSQFARADYNYDDRYLASATVRRDGSSRFGENNKYGTFPAFSAGWVLSNEEFFNLDSISNLKLRLSWGETGNQEIPGNATATTYVPRYATQSLFTNQQDEGTAYDITGANGGTLPSGFVRAQTGNPDLKWETSTQSNIGLDIDLFSNTVYASFDWYQKETKDILTLTRPVATLGEGAQKWVNGGTIENNGFEMILGYQDWLSFDGWDDLKVDASFNLSKSRNKVTALPQDVINSFGGNGQDKTILGRSINSVYGYVAEGLFQNQTEVDEHATQAGAAPGRIRWADLDGNGVINENDQDFFATTDPDFLYGFNLTLNYNDWDLNMFWQGVKGGQIRNNWRLFTDFTSLNIGSNYGSRVLDAWTVQNSDSSVPALTLVDTNGEGRQSSFFWEEGSYLKLRNISVGYRPNLDLLDKFGIQEARIYLQAANLLTLTPDGTLSEDPETPNEVFPVPRRITLGLEMTF